MRSKFDKDELSSWMAEQSYAAHVAWEDALEDRLHRAPVRVDKTKIRLLSGADFINEKVDQPPFLVEPFFPLGGIALLHGKRGLGKSMMAMTLTRAVAKGEQFLGMFNVTKGPVVYIQLDMTDFVFQERLKLAGEYYDIPNWHVVVGMSNLMRVKETDEWVKRINEIGPVLVIVDTLRKAHTMDENNSDSPSKFYNHIQMLFNRPSLLVIHHDRKTFEDGGPEGESFRGSGAWMDDVDAGLHLKKKGRGIVLGFSKTRTCPDIPDIPLEIDDQLMAVRSTTTPETFAGTRKDALRALFVQLRGAQMGLDRKSAASFARAKGFKAAEISLVQDEFHDWLAQKG